MEEERHSMAVAMTWVTHVTTMCLMMVIPAIVGAWLDHKLEIIGLTILGLLIGVPAGVWYLVARLKEEEERVKRLENQKVEHDSVLDREN